MAVSIAAGSLWAHHSTSAVFDMNKKIQVSGTLTKVDWINPHISIFLDAKGDKGDEDKAADTKPADTKPADTDKAPAAVKPAPAPKTAAPAVELHGGSVPAPAQKTPGQ